MVSGSRYDQGQPPPSKASLPLRVRLRGVLNY